MTDTNSTTTTISTTPSGFLGNLSPEQEESLHLLWTLILHLTEASSLGDLEHQLIRANTLQHVPSASSTLSTTTSRPHSRRDSILSRAETRRLVRKSSLAPPSLYHARFLQTLRDAGLGSSQIRAVRKFLACMTPDDVRFALLTAAKHEQPDGLLLRYLRISKWDVPQAFRTLLESLQWRAKGMHVDSQLLPRGELYAVQQTGNRANPSKAETGRGFIEQCRIGKCYVHGRDRDGRPMCVIRVRLHDPSAQNEEALNQFVTHTIETMRLLLAPPAETGLVIFDMGGFSLANMEYAIVKFIIRCFEIYYPEYLGLLLIHNAPRVFAGIWRIIKTWMSPSLAAKIHFTRTVADLEQFIPPHQIVRELGGAEDWEYEYTEPTPDENLPMTDFATRDALIAQRQSISEEFLAATSAWITASRAMRDNANANANANADADADAAAAAFEEAVSTRDALIEQLRANYWDLDPYVRAKNCLDRTGVIEEGGRVKMYPSRYVSVKTGMAVPFPLSPPLSPVSSMSPPPPAQAQPQLPVVMAAPVVQTVQTVQIQTAKILQVKQVERARVKIVNV